MLYPKNHGISKLVGTGDPRALDFGVSNPSIGGSNDSWGREDSIAPSTCA